MKGTQLTGGQVGSQNGFGPSAIPLTNKQSEGLEMAGMTTSSHIPSVSDNILNHSSVGRGGQRVNENGNSGQSRLDMDVERIINQSAKLNAAQKRRQEIEAKGEVVKDFMVGKTRIKINNAYCRDKTPEEVDAIIKDISIKAERALVAQELAKMKKAESR